MRANGSAATLPSCEVERGAGDAVDLGEQRRARQLGAAVERGEAGERADVVVRRTWRMTMLWLGYMAALLCVSVFARALSQREAHEHK